MTPPDIDAAQPDRVPGDQPGRSPLADGRWHRMHPLTPVLGSARVLLFAVAISLTQIEKIAQSVLEGWLGVADSAEGPDASSVPMVAWLIGAGAITGLLLVAGGFSWVSWRRREFFVEPDALLLRGGIINKEQRKARLDRVQAIDLDQPLVPRLLGLAKLSFDVAGGADSSFQLSYLRRAEAESLRQTMLDRVHVSRETQYRSSLDAPADHAPAVSDGAPTHGSAQREATEDARAFRPGANLGSRVVHSTVPGVVNDVSATLSEALAPYRVRVRADSDGRIVRVPPHRIALSMLLTFGTLATVVVLTLGLAGAVVATAFGYGAQAVSGGLALFFPMLAALHTGVQAFLRNSKFSVALTRDGLVVTHGLTTTTRRVIPVDRVQAVELKQPWLWRRVGWWQVRMNLATGAVLGEQKESVLLPVGSLDDAMMLMGLVLPDPGTPEGVSGRELMVEAMTASTTSSGTPAATLFTGPGRRARVLDPLTAKREAWARTSSMVVIRSGRLVRRVTCVPHARVQSMALAQGPVQRRLGLATVELHSTQGPITPELSHLDAATAQTFFDDHAAVTRDARRMLDGR